MGFELCNLSVEKGQKIQGFLKLPFSEEDMLPTTIICGNEDGPTVLVTGGIHNAEYVGIQTVVELSRQLEPSDIRGVLILIHIVNVNGFKSRTVSLSAEDGKNLNRVFPGDSNGTYTDKLAFFMEKELFPQIEYYIDVHNGDWFEDLAPFIYSIGNAPEKAVQIAERMAKQADVPYYVKSSLDRGGAYNYAGSLGIPAVLLERGSNGMWTKEEVEASQKDVRNILRYVGSLRTKKFGEDVQLQIPKLMRHAHYIDAKKGGCWFPKKKAGQVVSAGETIGVMKDYFGNIIEEIILNEDCIILYQTNSYSVPDNSPLVAYGHYDDCVEDETIHKNNHQNDAPEETYDIEEIHEKGL